MVSLLPLPAPRTALSARLQRRQLQLLQPQVGAWKILWENPLFFILRLLLSLDLSLFH